jgi:hypothetical protein
MKRGKLRPGQMADSSWLECCQVASCEGREEKTKTLLIVMEDPEGHNTVRELNYLKSLCGNMLWAWE